MTGMDEIYSRFSGMVYTYLMRLCGNDELAQELTQETFCQAIDHFKSFRDQAEEIVMDDVVWQEK